MPLASACNRRQAIQCAIATTAIGTVSRRTVAEHSSNGFSFALLGDLHYDKLEHHDMNWLQSHKPDDLSQIRNYSANSELRTPKLLASVGETSKQHGCSFTIQVGDLVEGLCGSEELARKQNQDALAFLEQHHAHIPFCFTKGNHDVTGDGASDAFKDVYYPFIDEQTKSFEQTKRQAANYCFGFRDSWFGFMDAYDPESLEWLEAALASRVSRRCFLIVHPPVVPYGARATWHLYSSEKDRIKRERLLELLAQHESIVLGGHIHRFCSLSREVGSHGRFVQLALSSVIPNESTDPKTELNDRSEYTPDQIRVEPKHSPETAEKRRAVYVDEAPFVRSFSYADMPGHAVIHVDKNRVTASLYRGTTNKLYREINLS